MALLIFSLLVGFFISTAFSLDIVPNSDSPYSKTISDLKESIVNGLGFAPEDVKISSFDNRDVLVGHSVAYEFDIEIGNNIIPLKLLEDVKKWEYFDLSSYEDTDSLRQGEGNGLIGRLNSQSFIPVLAPFQLEGPVELWIQDGKDLRLSLPNDIDAGVLKKILLHDSAVVTVKGARSVSLRHPLTFPLPLNRSDTTRREASALSALSQNLKHSIQSGAAPISLRIVGPTSLNSPSSPNKLKLKRLAPGLVELSLPPNTTVEPPPDMNKVTRILTPTHISTLWPLASVNGSDRRVLGFEDIISAIVDSENSGNGGKGASFRLLKADVSAETYVKMGMVVEKKVGENEMSGFPEWRTKPEKVRIYLEVVGKVEGDKLVPERVFEVKPVTVEDSVAWNLVTGNNSMSRIRGFQLYNNNNALTM